MKCFACLCVCVLMFACMQYMHVHKCGQYDYLICKLHCLYANIEECIEVVMQKTRRQIFCIEI